MTPRANELSILMRAAETLLNAATDEGSVLTQATELLGEQFGYAMRYLLLHDPERDELYAAAAAGEGSDDPTRPLLSHVDRSRTDGRRGPSPGPSSMSATCPPIPGTSTSLRRAGPRCACRSSPAATCSAS